MIVEIEDALFDESFGMLVPFVVEQLEDGGLRGSLFGKVADDAKTVKHRVFAVLK